MRHITQKLKKYISYAFFQNLYYAITSGEIYQN